MRYYVAVTDNTWFDLLAEIRPDEVNFWHPGGRGFRAIAPGDLLLFKLHAPRDVIAGGGVFIRHTRLPMSLAWEAFGPKNGVRSADEFHRRIRRYRSGTRGLEIDPIIGCSILVEPFFLPPELQVDVRSLWSPTIVSGKTFDTGDPVGGDLFERVGDALRRSGQPDRDADRILDPGEPGGSVYRWTRARLGQGAFRVVVTDAWERRCAVTGERTLPVLDAAHIKPFSRSGPHSPRNGVLLRADLHKLFDRGYMTITPDLRLEVSHRIRDEFENGREYLALTGRPLDHLPVRPDERPSPEYLAWHNDHVYRG